MKQLALVAAAMAIASSAGANGIDSRLYSCGALQAMVAQHKFVFISQATFGDFVVSDQSQCSGGYGGGSGLEPRSVATSDTPACPVNYCVKKIRGGG